MPFDPLKGMPTFGPAWDECIRLGVDTAMLLENLERTPAERIAAMAAHDKFVWQVRMSTGNWPPDEPPDPPAER